MLVAVDGETILSNLIRDFKRVTARNAKIKWQRNFFDHRLRRGESENEKWEYIRQNPTRTGLASPDGRWQYVLEEADLEP